MRKRILIVSGGEVSEDVLLKMLAERFDKIIAADRGLEALLRQKISPDELIGDFDSLDDRLFEKYIQNKSDKDTSLTKLNPIKDATDTEVALDHALSYKPDEIVILGATGSRIDHVLGNISLLARAKEAGVSAMLVDAHNRIRLISGRTVVKKEEQYGKYLSLIPYMGEAKGVTLRGVFYPLTDAVLSSGNTLGISNEITEDTAIIEIKEGQAILIESFD
ncbi:MAG: thiamine diphosphokinase [Lachnospiraceae bacterium]|nr:thiamine diphosphokinase [Lachnospiraceae bacterium]